MIQLPKAIHGSKLQAKISTLILLVIVTFPVKSEAFLFFHKWDKDVTEHGIEFKKLREDKSEVIIGFLKKDTIIDGYQCAKGWIHFYPDWSLKDFFLKEDMTINGNDIPAGTWVSFSKNGDMIRCAFLSETPIQGHLCDGSGGAKGIATAFYPGGRLKSFYPPTTVVVDGIPCKKSLLYYVGLHEDGSLRTCKLAETTIIDGVRYKKNEKIHFDTDGRVTSAE